MKNAHAISKPMSEDIAVGASKLPDTSLCDAGDNKFKTNDTSTRKRR